MALFLRIALLVVLQQSLLGSFSFNDDSDGLSAYSRNLVPSYSQRSSARMANVKVPGTYDVYPPLNEMTTVRTDDCNPILRMKVMSKAAFSSLKAESGTIYQGHVVKKEDQQCFRGFSGWKINTSLKKCLEYADENSANSFHFDQKTGYCQLYSSWREHKFRECRRGSDEKIFYIKQSEPDNFRPCRGVTVSLTASYTGDGNVQIVGVTKRDYCCCDIDTITLTYLSEDHEMTIEQEIPRFTYIYPSTDKGAWMNYTTVKVYASNSMIMMTEYIPEWDL